MTAAVILFVVPVLLFVLAFLYETYISFRRLYRPKSSRYNYVSATWEVTHTLLVFAVVMLLMMFTDSIDGIADAIFLAAFIAAAALAIRAVLYIYIFYVRKQNKIDWADWMFAVLHPVAALFLVIVVIQSLWYLHTSHPAANSQFLPYFIPGLVSVIAICALPILALYKTKD